MQVTLGFAARPSFAWCSCISLQRPCDCMFVVRHPAPRVSGGVSFFFRFLPCPTLVAKEHRGSFVHLSTTPFQRRFKAPWQSCLGRYRLDSNCLRPHRLPAPGPGAGPIRQSFSHPPNRSLWSLVWAHGPGGRIARPLQPAAPGAGPCPGLRPLSSLVVRRVLDSGTVGPRGTANRFFCCRALFVLSTRNDT